MKKTKYLDLYYVPHENWMGAATVVRQIFPSDQVSVFNNRQNRLPAEVSPGQLYDE